MTGILISNSTPPPTKLFSGIEGRDFDVVFVSNVALFELSKGVVKVVGIVAEIVVMLAVVFVTVVVVVVVVCGCVDVVVDVVIVVLLVVL